jgi:asparagine synthase (glutamine-hydrolysing)
VCGLVGVLGPGRQEVPPNACRVLAHRGPDDEAMVAGDGFALGFRRLAILDLSVAGRQPMRSEDGSCWIAFNGEVYNYIELRSQLEGKGETFRSRSDTEVLLALLRREDPEGLARLNGMFALAFIDVRSRKFVLVRDRLGVKPLYLWRRGEVIRFASELRALLAFPNAESTLNLEAVAAHFSLGYLPCQVCAFDGYEKLAPAHFLEGSLDSPASAEPRSWWSRPEPSAEAARGQQVGEEDEELGALLADATRIRLRSDVPVGVFLSGGIDSGLVSSYAATAGMKLPFALTVGWRGEEAGGIDETALAGKTARHMGLAHEAEI